MAASLRTRLRRGDVTYGTIITYSSPEVAETMALAGFDWLWVDMEHAAMSYETATHMLMAIQGHGLLGIVRVTGTDPFMIKRTLDLGADGLIVPMVNSAEEAQTAVRAAKYPPDGFRGVGIARAQGYGFRFGEYVRRANRDIPVIIQVEHIDAVHQIDAIVQVPGIDVIFIGPYDLSGSLGVPGQIGHPKVEEAIGEVVAACRKKKVALGILEMTPERVAKRAREGFQFISAAADSFLLGQAAKTFLADTKCRVEGCE